MSLHDQIRGANAALSKLSFEFTGLDKLMRRAFAATPFNLDEVSYFPMPLREFMSIATTWNVAMDIETAQRLLQMWWIKRVERYGHDRAIFGIVTDDMLQVLFEDGNNSRLNSTWQSAIVTADLPVGLVFMVDATARRHAVSADERGHRFGSKDIALRAFLATPEAVENYRLYGDMDLGAGCLDLCAHAQTEASWNRAFDLYAAPLEVAQYVALSLASAETTSRPAGLNERYLEDCRGDLVAARDLLASVGSAGRTALDLGVTSTVTNWRQA